MVGVVADTEGPPLCPRMDSVLRIIIIITKIIRVFSLLNTMSSTVSVRRFYFTLT